MSCFRYAATLGALFLVLGWTAAQDKPAPKPDKGTAQPATPAAPAPPKADPAATQVLEKAIAQADPKQLPWAEAQLWQQVSGQGVTFQAQGRYLIAPDYRRRLDLKVRIGDIDGTLEVVSDGTTVWQCMHIGNYGRVISKTDLKKALEAVNSPGTLPTVSEQLRQALLQEQTLAGVSPLLKSLNEQLVFTKQETGRWQGREMTVLVGVWNPDLAKQIAPPDRWPPGLPRTCRLYLEKETLWPSRLEWWGPAAPQREDTLLLQMEFRDPVIGKAGQKPPDHFATAFTFDPGNDPVTDQTKEITEQLKARGQQLAAQKPPAPKPPATPPKP